MSKKLLVAIDGSEHGWKALDMACDLARASDAEVILLHVVPVEPMPEGFREWAETEGIPAGDRQPLYRASRALGDRLTREGEERARNKGLTRITTRIAEGNPATEIIDLAKSQAVEMILLGSRGLGDARALLLGSVSHKVMHLAPCTCVAVK